MSDPEMVRAMRPHSQRLSDNVRINESFPPLPQRREAAELYAECAGTAPAEAIVRRRL